MTRDEPRRNGSPARPPPRTVLVLGGGGLKGLAHVGAWRALLERGIRPDAIVGTSIGALIGSLIAAGVDADELAEDALTLKQDDILQINRRVAWIRGVKQISVFTGERYRDYIRRILPVERFDQLETPLRVNTVSLVTGREVWLGTGARTDLPLADAVYASCALPVYFPPLPLDGDCLVDGGLHNVLAVEEAARWGAERIIAVDVSKAFEPASPETWQERGLVGVHQRVMEILAEKERRMYPAWDGPSRIDIRPDVGHLDTFEFGHAEFAIEQGYQAAVEALDRAEEKTAALPERSGLRRLLHRAGHLVAALGGRNGAGGD